MDRGGGITELSRELQRARTYTELLEHLHAHLVAFTGYRNFWLAVRDTDESKHVRLISETGPANAASEHALFPIEDDAMLAQLFQSNAIVVVEDARTDPRTNKAVVASLGNRTIINVPLTLLDKPFACFGMGTFGEEPVLPPSADLLDHLTAMAGFVSVAASRIRLDERTRQAQAERVEVERKLQRIQRMDSIGLLAGGVAHDFNNLITVIVASASMARTAGPKELADHIDEVIGAADRAQRLTRQLLAMSRSQRLTLQDLDPVALLGELVPLLRRVIPETITIDLIAPDIGVLVEADKTQLDQVIMNLCLNARDAMPGGGKITVEVEQVLVNGAFRETNPWAKPGRYVLLSVSDNGAGMSKEQMDRVYEPFFTTKREQAGTGLGLAVAHGIVQQHGGMLQCYSELGIGTTFKVYLPVLARAARVVGPKIHRAVRGGSERILVGEDDPAVRNVVRQILERAGYEVVLVRSGQEVLDTLAGMPFSLVLLDVVMPGLSASETLVKLHELHPDIHVLLCSGYTADAAITELLRDQQIPFLSKPYDPDALLRALRNLLDDD